MLTAFYSFRLISLTFLSYPNAPKNSYLNVHEADIFVIIPLLPAILTIVGAVSAVLLYHFYPLFLVQLTDNKLGRNIYTFLNGKYLIDIIYNNYIIRAGLQTGYNISKFLDRGVIELIGPYGLSSILSKTG